MAAEYGEIIDVSTTNVGENLAVDAAASATTIFVNDADTFNELGGQLLLNDTIYTYTNVAPDSGEITLASGLVADALADDRVEIYPPKPVTVALVDFGIEESDSVNVTLPHDMAIAEGFYEEGQRPAVLVDERSSGELYVVDIAATPTPPVEVEVTMSDGVPPIASPTPVVEGWVGALHVKWAAIISPDPVSYEVHISTVDDFTPDLTTLAGTTSATSFTIKSLPNDLPLAYDVTYYVKVVAYDLDGPAPAGSQGSAQMQPITGPDVSAAYVYAGRIAAPQIDGGEVNADLLLSGRISTRPGGTGAGVDQDASGIAIYDSSGIPQTTLAPDQSVFKGDADIGGLTVTESMSIRPGQHEISTGAELKLAAGITAPSTSPSVVQDWESITFTKAGDASFNAANLTSVTKVGTLWVCGYRDGSVYRVYRFNADGTYNSLGADAITSSTALQTTQIVPNGLCYTICSNHTIFRHKAMAGNYSYIWTDDFTTNINSARWTSTNGATWDSATQSAKLTGSDSGGVYIRTDFINQMKDSFISAKVTRASGTDTQDLFLTVSEEGTGTQLAEIKLEGSTLTFRVYDNTLDGTVEFSSSITYNPTTHAYWKISELDATSGGDFRFSTSADGVTWTDRYTADHDFTIGNLSDVRFGFLGQEEGGSGTLVAYIDEVRNGLNNEGQSFQFATLDTDDNPMVLGNDGTNLLLADHDNSSGNDRLRVRTISNLVTMVIANTEFSANNSIMDAPLAGILKGSFDLGASRWITKRTGSFDWWSINSSTFAWVPAEYFAADNGGSKHIAWDGSNFWALGTNGQLYKHTTVTHTSGTATVGWVYASTWYDSNATGGTHETTVSPIASITLKKRARVTVTTPDIPGAGGTDDPNCIRVYAGLNSGAMTLQTTTGAGVHSVVYNALVTGGAAPPGSNNFPTATPAAIKSTSGGLIISGNGSMVGGSFSGSLVATEIGNAVDLNSVTTPGLYTQSSDAEAAAGTNYPALAPYAGVLEVFGVGAILSQRYSAYRNSDVNPTPNVWERTSVSGTWSAWQPLHYDTGWISTISSVATAATGWTLDEAYARRVNNTVWVRIVASRTGGTLTVTTSTDPTNTDVCTLLTRWRHTTPTQGLYSVTDRLSGCSVNSSGVVALFAAAPPTSIANTNQISVSGSYII